MGCPVVISSTMNSRAPGSVKYVAVRGFRTWRGRQSVGNSSVKAVCLVRFDPASRANSRRISMEAGTAALRTGRHSWLHSTHHMIPTGSRCQGFTGSYDASQQLANPLRAASGSHACAIA